MFHTKKTEKHRKNPAHSLLLLTRFSRDDLLSTESDNIFIIRNHFNELNLHQFHKDQQLLANHLMIGTFAIMNTNRSCVSIPITP